MTVLSDFLIPYILEIFCSELNQLIWVRIECLGKRYLFGGGAVYDFATAIYQSIVKTLRSLMILLLLRWEVIFLQWYSVLIRSMRVGRFQSGFTILTWGWVMRDFGKPVRRRSAMFIFVLLIVSLLSAGV